MKKEGILLIISGYSGTGKGTVVKRLLEKYSDYYSLSISATTRKKRDNEEEAREYFFKTKDEFTKMIENDELIEYACYVDNYYGTPKKYVESKLAAGQNVILEIEIQGACNVKKQYENAVLIFLLPPSIEELVKRLNLRATENDDAIKKRMERAKEEAKSVYEYDYIVVNDEIENCVDTIHNIILSEQLRTKHQQDFIKEIEKDLLNF